MREEKGGKAGRGEGRRGSTILLEVRHSRLEDVAGVGEHVLDLLVPIVAFCMPDRKINQIKIKRRTEKREAQRAKSDTPKTTTRERGGRKRNKNAYFFCSGTVCPSARA